jgi:hypothetical protein
MKKILKNLLLFSIVLSLSSCLNYNQITTIKTDNTGKMFVHFWRDMGTDIDSLLLTRVGLFNKDSLQTKFEAPFTEINFTKIFKDFKDSTLHAQLEFEFSDFDSLNYLPFFSNAKLSNKNAPDDEKIFSQFIQPVTIGFDSTAKPLKVKYIYYLPGEIVEHNANSLSRNKLTWEFSLDQIGSGKTIKARYIPFRLKETPQLIYTLALIVIIIVLVFLFTKRKK